MFRSIRARVGAWRARLLYTICGTRAELIRVRRRSHFSLLALLTPDSRFPVVDDGLRTLTTDRWCFQNSKYQVSGTRCGFMTSEREWHTYQGRWLLLLHYFGTAFVRKLFEVNFWQWTRKVSLQLLVQVRNVLVPLQALTVIIILRVLLVTKQWRWRTVRRKGFAFTRGTPLHHSVETTQTLLEVTLLRLNHVLY